MNDSDLVKVIHSIADYIMQVTNSGKNWMEDWRKDAPYAGHYQTKSGLFLRYYYSLPNKLITPWGEWHFGGSGYVNEPENAQIRQTLGAKLYYPEPGVNDFPIYALTSFNDVILSTAIMRARPDFLNTADLRNQWIELHK